LSFLDSRGIRHSSRKGTAEAKCIFWEACVSHLSKQRQGDQFSILLPVRKEGCCSFPQ
ncbi:hypothetical protein BaRGS_00022883, partial [Batillaria attramentaria]